MKTLNVALYPVKNPILYTVSTMYVPPKYHTSTLNKLCKYPVLFLKSTQQLHCRNRVNTFVFLYEPQTNTKVP